MYPAATVPIGLGVAIGTYLMTKAGTNALTRYSMSAIYFVAVLASIFQSSRIFSLSSDYFTFVGKANNSQYRLTLISAALQEIEQKPIFGTFFRGSATVQATVLGNRTYQLPVHNDYITIVLCGGIFFLMIFLIIPVYLNLRTLRVISSPKCSVDQRRIIVAFLASINVALASSFANPILINPANSTIFYCLIAGVVALSFPLNQREPIPDPELKLVHKKPGGL
jgi:hypothetical protein